MFLYCTRTSKATEETFSFSSSLHFLLHSFPSSPAGPRHSLRLTLAHIAQTSAQPHSLFKTLSTTLIQRSLLSSLKDPQETMKTTTTSLAILALAASSVQAQGIVDNVKTFVKLAVSFSPFLFAPTSSSRSPLPTDIPLLYRLKRSISKVITMFRYV